MIYQPGDIFCTCSPGFVPKLILRGQAFWALDGEAEYSHAGIIVERNGRTFESRLTRIGFYDISDFNGCPILVGRHVDMNRDVFHNAMLPIVMEHNKKIYPWWRLMFHIIPPLARKIGNGKFLVCSEVVSELLRRTGIVPHSKGWNPDNIADMMGRWKGWDIIYERES